MRIRYNYVIAFHLNKLKKRKCWLSSTAPYQTAKRAVLLTLTHFVPWAIGRQLHLSLSVDVVARIELTCNQVPSWVPLLLFPFPPAALQGPRLLCPEVRLPNSVTPREL